MQVISINILLVTRSRLLKKMLDVGPTSGWSPRAGPRSAERWWLTVLSNILQSISVINTREWHSEAHILLFWALLEVKAGFRVIPTKLLREATVESSENSRNVVFWAKCILDVATHPSCLLLWLWFLPSFGLCSWQVWIKLAHAFLNASQKLE